MIVEGVVMANGEACTGDTEKTLLALLWVAVGIIGAFLAWSYIQPQLQAAMPQPTT